MRPSVLALGILAACTRGEPTQPNAKATRSVSPPVAEQPERAPDPQSILERAVKDIDGPAAALVLDVSRDPKVLASVRQNGLDPFSSTFRPGSTVKPLLAFLAGDRGLLPPRQEHDCTGQDPEDPRFTCFDAHGRLDLRDALMLSCNTYFYRVASDLGYPAVREGFSSFGLAATTGLESNEARGTLLARPEEANLDPSASADDFARVVGIGHGPFEVTLAQLALAYADLAHRLREADSDAGKANETRTLVIEEVAAGLRDVVQKPRGTGVAAAVPGQCVAGKTGTAEAWSWDAPAPESPIDNGLFVGFAPATDPTVVIAVVATGGSGGSNAAPVAGKFLEAWFRATGAPPHPCPPEDDGPPC